MSTLNLYSERSIESTIIEFNGEELENIYEFFLKFEKQQLYSKVTIMRGKKAHTHDLSQHFSDNINEESFQNNTTPLLTIENTEEGICVKHNGVLLSNLVKLYIHIKAKMTNYSPSTKHNATDGTELFEAYYVTEISENRYNIVHIV
jgi:hypothetical protein